MKKFFVYIFEGVCLVIEIAIVILSMIGMAVAGSVIEIAIAILFMIGMAVAGSVLVVGSIVTFLIAGVISACKSKNNPL